MDTISKNSNCLENVHCPACGFEDGFWIDVVIQTRVYMTDDGHDLDDAMDSEWDDASTITCGSCGHAGVVRDFRPRLAAATPTRP